MVMKTRLDRLIGVVATALLLVVGILVGCGSKSRDFAEGSGGAKSNPGSAGTEPGSGDASGHSAGGASSSTSEPNPPDLDGAPDGQPCSASAECASRECVDEVCCDTACDGVCQACVEDSTGEPDGTCAPIASGPDPDADLQSDIDHCGACEISCAGSSLPGTTRVCDSGQCSVTCATGTIGDGVNACIPATTVTAGAGFSCGLLEDGHVKCWGDPDVDFHPSGLENVLFRSITAASSSVCGIRDNGLAHCWGNNPTPPSSGAFHALTAGTDHVCGIRDNGTLSCWGNPSDEVVTPPLGTYRFIASGADYSCAMVRGGELDGRVTCWGAGTQATSDFPTTASETTFTQIYGGGLTGWGILPDGTLRSWGQVLFSGPAGVAFTTLGAGGYANRCGILSSDSSIACWGTPNSPVAVAPSGTFGAVAMGGAHACAVKTNGSIQCWGSNDLGQAPAEVAGPFQGHW
ncbi:MAG TPA: RCC1 domain-containing protein [Polyangiaceae bacterium]|nr:RCC1 domain-containing protein [Polyangiaceae bacterium]